MFEKKHEKLLPKRKFIHRLLRCFLIGFSLILLSLLLGMVGYHYLEHLPWLDAYVNAAMILSGMGPLISPQTSIGKFFAGSYALFSGLIFILIIGIIFSPIAHRIFHKFHLQDPK